MTGSRRLTWVTALTVASLLLGGGAVNALAEGKGGGGGHGDGAQAKPDHQQQQHQDQRPAVVTDQAGGHAGDAEHKNAAQDAPGQAVSHEKRAEHADVDNQQTTVTTNTDVEREDADVDDEDLVTPPARVTEEMKPGLGCGDADDHTGAPGNPDLKCRHPHDNDGDASVTSTTASTDMDADDQSAARGDEGPDD